MTSGLAHCPAWVSALVQVVNALCSRFRRTENIRIGVDLFFEWFVIADQDNAMTEIFKFLTGVFYIYLIHKEKSPN
jgi:hypothetical protein